MSLFSLNFTCKHSMSEKYAKGMVFLAIFLHNEFGKIGIKGLDS